MKIFRLNSVSVVIPILNERENLPDLLRQVEGALHATARKYEMIFIDDGSTDGSAKYLQQIARNNRMVKVIEFSRNFGQTAAMKAGMEHASCDYVVTLDGDLQNDPHDIAALLEKLDEGFDLVHGWRRDRQDRWLDRKLPSQIANQLISRVCKFPVHDLGCSLKAMRRDVAVDLELYGQLHRFIPILAASRGARCLEIPVNHRPRQNGTSKYGINRTLTVILDLMTVKYLISYCTRPMQFFGRFGLWSLFAAAALTLATLAMKLIAGVDMTGNPLLLLSAVSFFAALQFFSMGILGEVAARNYFASSQRPAYTIRRTANLQLPPQNNYRETG